MYRIENPPDQLPVRDDGLCSAAGVVNGANRREQSSEKLGARWNRGFAAWKAISRKDGIHRENSDEPGRGCGMGRNE